MRLIDLTLPIPVEENGHPTVVTEEWQIGSGGLSYTGIVHRFAHWSMSGTYLDLPGHIRETDDGLRADDYPLERLFEVPTAVLHLPGGARPRKIHAEDLQRACVEPFSGGGLILHALGDRRFDEVPERSVALSKDAVHWIIDRQVRLLVSDVYEHHSEPENVFFDLFAAGVATVCCPINLQKLNVPRVSLTVLAPRFPGVTQLPCRVVARIDD